MEEECPLGLVEEAVLTAQALLLRDPGDRERLAGNPAARMS